MWGRWRVWKGLQIQADWEQGNQTLHDLCVPTTITETSLNLTKAIRSCISRLHLAAQKDNCFADFNISRELDFSKPRIEFVPDSL